MRPNCLGFPIEICGHNACSTPRYTPVGGAPQVDQFGQFGDQSELAPPTTRDDLTPEPASNPRQAAPARNPSPAAGTVPAAETPAPRTPSDVTPVNLTDNIPDDVVGVAGTTQFARGVYALNSSNRADLDQWVRDSVLNGSLTDGSTITVWGYASTDGSLSVNQRLSTRRAESAAAALRDLVRAAGLRSISFVTEGRGPVDVIRRPDGSEDRQASRRVYVFVSSAAQRTITA